MKKIVAGSLIIICILCLFSSCGIPRSELYGNWYNTKDIRENIRFDSYGSGHCVSFDNYGNMISYFTFAWIVRNNTLLLKVEDNIIKYTIAFNGNYLQITNEYGVTTTYSR